MFKMKREDFEKRVETLTLSKEELFKVEQTNELIEMIDKLRLTMDGR